MSLKKALFILFTMIIIIVLIGGIMTDKYYESYENYKGIEANVTLVDGTIVEVECTGQDICEINGNKNVIRIDNRPYKEYKIGDTLFFKYESDKDKAIIIESREEMKKHLEFSTSLIMSPLYIILLFFISYFILDKKAIISFASPIMMFVGVLLAISAENHKIRIAGLVLMALALLLPIPIKKIIKKIEKKKKEKEEKAKQKEEKEEQQDQK